MIEAERLAARYLYARRTTRGSRSRPNRSSAFVAVQGLDLAEVLFQEDHVVGNDNSYRSLTASYDPEPLRPW